MFKSLKTKIVSNFILLVIIPVIISGIIIIYQTQKTQYRELESFQSQMTNRIASEFQNYINTNMTMLQQIIELLQIDPENTGSFKKKLLVQLLMNNNINQFILLDKEGRIAATVHRYKVLPESKKTSMASEMEYLFPKVNQKIYIGEVIFDPENGEPLADISMGIRDQKTQELQGVLITTLRLKPIWNLLSNIETIPGQDVYITDSRDKVIAHPNPSVVLKNTSFHIPSESITTGLLGDKVHLKYLKVNIGNQFFTVVAEYKTTEAFSLLRKISTIVILVILSTLLMSALLIHIHMKNIVIPIRHIVDVAKEIEEGNLEKTVTVKSNTEIQDLASAFNNMTSKLKDNTIQLQEFNTGLQKKIRTEIEKTRRIEQMLFEQKKFADMGQMINAIAHQWRQPLNNIGLIQQYLYTGFMSDSISKEEYDSFSQSQIELVQEMSETIDNFRNFFNTGKTRERFSIIESVVEFMRLSNAQLTNRNITYFIKCKACTNKHFFDTNTTSVKCDSENLHINGYPGEFKQVLQNIIMNSQDSFLTNNTEEPSITISIERKNNKIEIVISDNAGGIPDDVMPNIFNPYFTTKEEGKGTGIGLYISKVIIAEHFNGSIYAENNGEGVDFIINLPA